MSIEDFGEKAKTKITELEQKIVEIQKALEDAGVTLDKHKAALAAIDAISPELKGVLNDLFAGHNEESKNV